MISMLLFDLSRLKLSQPSEQCVLACLITAGFIQDAEELNITGLMK